jgi:hypothetical protein
MENVERFEVGGIFLVATMQGVWESHEVLRMVTHTLSLCLCLCLCLSHFLFFGGVVFLMGLTKLSMWFFFSRVHKKIAHKRCALLRQERVQFFF